MRPGDPTRGRAISFGCATLRKKKMPLKKDGSCPKCGAPIYVNTIGGFVVGAPQAVYSCECLKRAKRERERSPAGNGNPRAMPVRGAKAQTSYVTSVPMEKP
jgi:hypothetical protein